MMPSMLTTTNTITLGWDRIEAFLSQHHRHIVQVLQVEQHEGTAHYRELLATVGNATPLHVTYLVGGDVRETFIFPIEPPSAEGSATLIVIERYVMEAHEVRNLIACLDDTLVSLSDLPNYKLVT